MRKPIAFVPSHRISARLQAGGGISVQQALSQAATRVESLRDHCVGALDEKVDSLAALAIEQPFPHAHAYALATEIYGLAATYALGELAEASNSLCELLTAGAWTGSSNERGKLAEGVRVHLDVLRTLRRPDVRGDNAARAAVLEGLRRVVQRTAAVGDGD